MCSSITFLGLVLLLKTEIMLIPDTLIVTCFFLFFLDSLFTLSIVKIYNYDLVWIYFHQLCSALDVPFNLKIHALYFWEIFMNIFLGKQFIIYLFI